MQTVGTVAELWRYPVKSMQGERVKRLAVGPGGADGDRMLAVVDPAAGKVLSAKRWADLLMASARTEGDDVVLTLPSGAEHAASDPAVHDALSEWLELAVRLVHPRLSYSRVV
ncbi:MAG: MOSC N-terminal beta barrel domain-containing protein [Acidimicrobiales bacterium]|nr:MOSC N-terminal beta barrel domain-containing protein [Acidimicrobiales bacterium]